MPLHHHSDAHIAEVAEGLVKLVGPREASEQLTRLYGWDRSFQVLARLDGAAAYQSVAQLTRRHDAHRAVYGIPTGPTLDLRL